MRMQVVTQKDEIGQWLEAELEEVETRFTAELMSDLDCVNVLVGHIEQYRGKMLRPRLLLTAAMASAAGEETMTEAHRMVGTVIEMVHMATLVHDDILDDAQIRRRGGTVSHLEGNEAAVMLGDYLISHAYHLCSSIGNEAISRAIAETTNTICEGELLQLANRNNWALDEETYFEIIRRKTASLCGTSCRLAAMLWGVAPEISDTLHDYGVNVGIAFQIVDDLLDLIGAEATVGKTLGRDLEKGKLTLPMIRHLALVDPTECQRLRTTLQGCRQGQNQEPLQELQQALSDSGAVQYAQDCANRLVVRAKDCLGPLPDSPAKLLLEQMADAVVTRRF